MPDPDFTKEDAFIKWKEEASLKRDELLRSNPPTFDAKVWQSFKNLILVPKLGRCAYCEGRYNSGEFGDAEHYRPKSEVTEGRKAVSHPGYYWLAYEWQNLLLSCRKCNSKHSNIDPVTGKKVSHPGKLCEFPVSAGRVSSPGGDPDTWMLELGKEKPLLLHPYYENPDDHFLAAKGGWITAKTPEGKATIDVCDLNRKELREERAREESNVEGRALRVWLSDDPQKTLAEARFGPLDQFSTYLNQKLRESIKARQARMDAAVP